LGDNLPERVARLEERVSNIENDIVEIKADIKAIQTNDIPHLRHNPNFWIKVIGAGGISSIVIEFIRYLPELIRVLRG